MSVIVKGMEMPENCTRCDYIGLNVAIGCPVMSGTNGRATDCPLGALPDKHGRLGDLDALIIDLMDRGLEGIQTDDWAEIQQTVMDAPTIVESEGENADHE